MDKQFKAAPSGTRIWVITVVVTLPLLGIIPAIMFTLPEITPLMQWLISGMMTAILGILALFLVRGYALAGNALKVRRSFWDTRIGLEGLKSAVADPRALEGAWKTVGNDGVFAIHGWFRSKRLGKFRAFVTNTACTVILDFGEKRIVISPEDPAGFVNAVNRSLRRA